MRTGTNRDGTERLGPLPTRLEDIRGSERAMVLVRWGAVAFSLVQVLAYTTAAYPPGVKAIALGLVGLLAVANVVISILAARDLDLRRARALSMAGMVLDVLVASGFVWVYAFDPTSALWAVLFILPLEGAIRFALPGAIGAWVASTAIYIGREVWGSGRYDYPLEWNSISFRMGIGFLIALVAGLMARNLLRERQRIEEALAEASRIDHLRARLVATLAHDVRSPLTTIRGTLSTLIRYGTRVPDTTREELLTSADLQARRLERLATDLLDLARLEGGRLELHPRPTPVAEAVQEGLSFADPEKRFEVKVAPSLEVLADRNRLEQIIVNLATNALRYGEPPFVVDGGPGQDGEVEIRFVDHGPGVDEAERSALFEPFRSEQDAGSVGLGLAIVRGLAQAQGGDVDYEPNSPRGARFTLRLPEAAAAAEA